MKSKRIIIIFACVMLALFTLGLTDVMRMGNEAMGEEAAGTDRLIGVFVTTEYIDMFDFEGFFNDNAGKIISGGEIGPEESEKYQGRLYASLVDRENTSEDGEAGYNQGVVFEGVDGMNYFVTQMEDESGGFYSSSSGDEGISEGNIALSYTDEGDSISIEGTIYVSTASGQQSFYCNPVYQTASGQVYTVSGRGMSIGGELTEGQSHTTELKDERSQNENGVISGSRTTVKITISYISPPERIRLIQLDGESNVLSAAEYEPGAMPESIEAEQDTEYIILETLKAGDKVERRLFQREDESLESLYCREDGICIKQYTGIIW